MVYIRLLIYTEALRLNGTVMGRYWCLGILMPESLEAWEP